MNSRCFLRVLQAQKEVLISVMAISSGCACGQSSDTAQTTEARAHVKVRVWVDKTGRITRAKLTDSADDPAVDQAVQNDVLGGLTLPEAPPSDMPIVLLLSEVRPN